MSDDEKRCEGCGHHEGEGCGCPPLTLASMGLMPFMDGEARRCPKCNMQGLRISYHEMIILTVDSDPRPCQEWVQKGLLGGTIGEHLCCRCQGCGYGFPMRCADA